jgi:hypothetical protein
VTCSLPKAPDEVTGDPTLRELAKVLLLWGEDGRTKSDNAQLEDIIISTKCGLHLVE